MQTTFDLFPGGHLRCFTDRRFKQGCMSVQLVRPMRKVDAAMNAILPAVLLRGTEKYPDLRAITLRLDDLYGASVGALVRRIGDYQTTGLYLGFMEDRYAMDGDRVLEPMMELLGELLWHPCTENGGFLPEFVESEKKNLISTIESELNDKRVYAAGQLMRLMCKADAFGVPRLGAKEDVAAIDPVTLYRHWQNILRESRLEVCYVGAQEPETVLGLVKQVFGNMERCYVNLPVQTPFRNAGGTQEREEMQITQSKLCLGYTTPITNQDSRFAAMQVLCTLFGAGMTSKLFTVIREQMSLCYSIGSGYYGSKGIVTVSAGIDADQEETVRSEIAHQLVLCQEGQITAAELDAAKEAVLTGLQTVHDSPGAIEGYYSTAALSGLSMDLDAYRAAVRAVSIQDAVEAAKTIQLHSGFFLKGVGA